MTARTALLSLALALGFGGSAAQAANGLPDSFTVTTSGNARFIFLQPAHSKCQGTACSTLQQAVKQAPAAATPPADPTPPNPTPVDPQDVTLAEQHINQAWQVLNAHMSSGWLDSAGIDFDTLRFSVYNTSASQSTPVYTRDSENRVVSRSVNLNGSISRGGIPAEVCGVIANKGLAGVGCSGGTIVVSIAVYALDSYVESNGTVRDYLSQPPVSASRDWSTATASAIFAATPNAGASYGFIPGI